MELLSLQECHQQCALLNERWSLADQTIVASFSFPDFVTALDFVVTIGKIAEEQQHHPDIFLSYGQVNITLTTHSVKGLTKKDFSLASAIDTLI